MPQIVMIRHGLSSWNKENRFTGWIDVPLAEEGVLEAKSAGQALKKAGFDFDLVYTSRLKRAIRTANYILEEMDLEWIDVKKTWKLNERHYGALQGYNKAEKEAEVGAAQVMIWRRSFDIAPPQLDAKDPTHPMNDKTYSDIDQKLLPSSESLKDTIQRVLPYWEEEILPAIKSGRKILISAHGNTLRALIKDLANISDDEITSLNIPTGVPYIFDFDETYSKPVKMRTLEN